MNFFYCDASAAIKRYLIETGSDSVNQLFENARPRQILMLTPGVGEVFAALVRRRNTRQLSPNVFAAAQLSMLNELAIAPRTEMHSAPDTLVFASLPLIERHSINSTDALVLRSALDVAVILRQAGHDLVLVASDARLVRAALAEGLTTFNPEADDQALLDRLISA